ncbi:MAG: hypothetical protein ACIALR_05290 [Blastopirellula sp. JB062]
MRRTMLCSLFVAASAWCGTTVTAETIDLGLPDGYSAEIAAKGLTNPSGVSFSPSGTLTICDSGDGRVLTLEDGELKEYVTGFPTEYWKVDADSGEKRFKLGPLSAIWLDSDTLAVTNAGLGDGAETVLFFKGPGKVDAGEATNSVPPTSDDMADKGEGNLTGMTASADGKTIYLAGQGSDAKSWILKVDVADKKLSPLFSADENDIAINSPMDTLLWGEDSILALYSGAGGKDDGLIVQWNLESGKPVKQWTVPGLLDPMGFAVIPGTKKLAVVDNNWALTEVKPGKLATVTLPEESGAAEVEVLTDKLLGPVACKFGPDGKLYVGQLGKEFDKNEGQVIAVSGLK